jgi:hypothetical protein
MIVAKGRREMPQREPTLRDVAVRTGQEDQDHDRTDLRTRTSTPCCSISRRRSGG